MYWHFRRSLKSDRFHICAEDIFQKNINNNIIDTIFEKYVFCAYAKSDVTKESLKIVFMNMA